MNFIKYSQNAHSTDNDHLDVKCDDGIGTVKSEPPTPIVYVTADEVYSEDVSVKSEITLSGYECTPQDIAVQLTNNEKESSTAGDKASKNLVGYWWS